MNENKIQIISQLKEIANEYGLTFSSSDDDQFVYFRKHEVGVCDPSFMLTINYDVCKVHIGCVGKTVDLHQLNNYVRLLCEVIA
ncbi:hypothetical protein Barba19A_gp028 [Rheinheimera phage vB_RspM_Barba19A]|uniref:Uncharacterized protein n=1 Tax=Rheinheimera phage vB_RspM_Barba19A TaxID=2565658 RepID=A0A4P8N7D4_9CAUD|nr:hypothetical protein HOV47_gp028 [Rheinheimera phage vB_RspM_Barba19A]QCQ61868.1 hypothetical protein Barba19A_gp028 [Rheinheimera phage vB_RspM_Barba19A]